jgi:DNA-binding SARP family transcriptional activator
MDFRVLGPVEVVADGAAIPLSGQRHERIIAMLLVSPNRLVTLADLVDVVWPASPPVTATSQVRNCVAALRRKLCGFGMPDDWLVRKGAGYVLAIDCELLDWWRFQSMVQQGRQQAHAGNVEVAVHLLRQAAELWRGPALAGLDEESMTLRAEAVRLEELRMQALEERFALQISLGQQHECLAELAAVAHRQPLRARLQISLMLALHRCGRSAEALGVYDRTRRSLADEYGLEPSPELRDIQHYVLTDRHRQGPVGANAAA